MLEEVCEEMERGSGEEVVPQHWQGPSPSPQAQKKLQRAEAYGQPRGLVSQGVDAVMGVLLWPVTYKRCDLRLVLIGWEEVWLGNRKIFQFPFISPGMYLWLCFLFRHLHTLIHSEGWSHQEGSLTEIPPHLPQGQTHPDFCECHHDILCAVCEGLGFPTCVETTKY